ncbi:MAG: hypothetical protein KTR14_03815 [Vampirovibrio sp.]|nr:hypothetical protein [Vampirovibrio sp.]
MKEKSRFYEKDPLVNQAVEALFSFPPAFQSIIAEGLAEIAERECRANELAEQLKSLGTDKVMALYKSKRKGRTYDQNPQTHKMMNYLMLLSEENRQLMARETLQLMSCIQDYLSLCKEYESQTSAEAMQTLTGTYTGHGEKATREFLKTVKVQFMENLAGRGEKITGFGNDMAVKGD